MMDFGLNQGQLGLRINVVCPWPSWSATLPFPALMYFLLLLKRDIRSSSLLVGHGFSLPYQRPNSMASFPESLQADVRLLHPVKATVLEEKPTSVLVISVLLRELQAILYLLPERTISLCYCSFSWSVRTKRRAKHTTFIFLLNYYTSKSTSNLNGYQQLQKCQPHRSIMDPISHRFGDVLISLILTTQADRIGRINTLIFGSLLKILTRLCCAESESIIILTISGILGVISATEGEIGPFMPIQQSALSQLVEDCSDSKEEVPKNTSAVFGYYNMAGYLVKPWEQSSQASSSPKAQTTSASPKMKQSPTQCACTLCSAGQKTLDIF